MSETSRVLVIGFGNLDRQDDGVAYFVVNALRRRLGQGALAKDDTGLESLGSPTDSIFVTQLGPELLDTAAEYARLVFVDAHVREDVGPLHWEVVRPEYASATFTHHMTPALFMALLQALHQRQAAGYIVSVRGQSFDFERGLTAATQAWVEAAAEEILQLLDAPTSPDAAASPAGS